MLRFNITVYTDRQSLIVHEIKPINLLPKQLQHIIRKGEHYRAYLDYGRTCFEDIWGNKLFL